MRFFTKGLLSFLALINVGWAFDIPEHDGYVTDQAGVLWNEEIENLEQLLSQIEESTTVEIAILTVQSTKGITISDYATQVGQAWGVGKGDIDNGLMIVAAIKDRKWFMATGYGLEGSVSDALAKRIGEKNFPPHFRKGNYYRGFRGAIYDVKGLLEENPEIVSKYGSSGYGDDSVSIGFMDVVLGIAIPVGLFLVVVLCLGFAAGVRTLDVKYRFLIVFFTAVILALIELLLLVFAFIFLVMALLPPPKKGARTSDHSGSSWDSGGGWGSSDSFDFGGGDFGGGGAGGSW